MQLDFATFLRIVNPILNEKLPVMLRGRHGIGKSQVVYQIAKERNLPVVERRASQMTEGDLMGLPIVTGKSTMWNPPDWFKRACDEPVLLFLDELDRATNEVRQGIFELTDSRKLNGHVLHPDTLIMAAVNGGVNGAQYQVGEMDPAELDRWSSYDLSPTIEDWLNWAKSEDNISPFVHDFINLNREHLENAKAEFEPNKVYPSRRSWKRVNDVLVKAKMFEEGNTADIRNIAVGIIGFEAAIAFHDFVEKYDRQVTPEDVIMKGKINKTEKFGIIEHCALIDKIFDKKILVGKLTKKQADNVVRYFFTLPSEAAMKLWHGIAQHSPDYAEAFHKHEVDGRAPGNYIGELLTGMSREEMDSKLK